MSQPFDRLKRPKVSDVLLNSDINVPALKRNKPNHKIAESSPKLPHLSATVSSIAKDNATDSLVSLESTWPFFDHEYATMYHNCQDIDQLLKIVKQHLAKVILLLEEKNLPQAEACLKQIWCVLSLILASAPGNLDTDDLFSGYESVVDIVDILYGFKSNSRIQSINSLTASSSLNHIVAFYFFSLQYLVQKITYDLKRKTPIGDIFTKILPVFLSTSEMSLWIQLLSSGLKNSQNLLKIVLALNRLLTYYTKTGFSDRSIGNKLYLKIIELQLRANNTTATIDTSLLQDNEFLSSVADSQFFEDLYKAAKISTNLALFQHLEAYKSSIIESSVDVSVEDASQQEKQVSNPELVRIDHELNLLKGQDIKSFKQLDALTIDMRDFCSKNNSSEDFKLIKDIMNTIFEMSSTYRQYSRIKNVSNLMFNLGLNSIDKLQALESWTISVAHELYLLDSFPEQQISAYERFTLKLARISNALYEQALYHESMILLKKYLLALQNIYKQESLKPFISQLILKILKADHKSIDLLMQDGLLLDSSKANIYIDLMQILTQSKKLEDELALLLTEKINITSYSEYLRCVFAFYSNSGVHLVEMPVNICPVGLATDCLYLCGIFVLKLHRETWSDFNLRQAISYLHSYFDNIKPNNEHGLEQELLQMLSTVLRCNGLHFQNIHLLEYVQQHRDSSTWNWNLVASLCSSFVAAGQNDSVKALVTQFDKLHQSTKWKMIVYEHCVAEAQIDLKIFITLNNDIKQILELPSSDTKISLNDKIENLLMAAKFYILKSKHDILDHNYPQAYASSRFAIKILVSVARKVGNTYSNRMFTNLKIESSQLLSIAYLTILECLIYSGVLFEFEYYIREFSILNDSLSIGLPLLCKENLTQIAYFKILMKDNHGALDTLSKIEFLTSSLTPFKLWYNLKSSSFIKRIAMGGFEEDIHCTMAGPEELIWKFPQPIDDKLEVGKQKSQELFSFRAIDLEFIQFLISNIKNNVTSPKVDPNVIRLKILQKIMKFRVEKMNGHYKAHSSMIPSLKECNNKPFVSKELFESFDETLNFISNIMNSNVIQHFQNFELSHFVELATQALFALTQFSDCSSNHLSIVDQILAWRDHFKTSKFTNQRDYLTASSHIPSNPLAKETGFRAVHSRLRDSLPDEMIVVSIDYDHSSNSLVLSKFTKGAKCLFNVNISIDHKDGKILFQKCLDSIDHVINASNNSTKIETTSKVTSRELRKEWWKLRFGLDDQLKSLLSTTEHDWLGGITGIFNDFKDDSLLNEIECKLSQVFGATTSLHPEFLNLIGSGVVFLQRHNGSFEHFCEALATYLMESDVKNNQLHKRAIISKLQEVIKEHEQKLTKLVQQSSIHVVLVPGKSCSRIPWESMDCLRSRSVSRMPSILLLIDLLENKSSEVLNKNLHYVINPEGDLVKTQRNFGSKFEAMENWRGSVGCKPEKDSLMLSIFECDAFVYLGHGGCEQLLNSSIMLKKAFGGDQLPPSLLIGCSSGALSSNGLVDESGYIYNWLSGGSPMVLANLWDVTDKDIDAFSANLFEEWGMFSTTDVGLNQNISEAVCNSRDSCTLKYLNGAAPIVYGLPMYIKC